MFPRGEISSLGWEPKDRDHSTIAQLVLSTIGENV
jgi:hypothetical protein